jgi:hypothetical protein
LPQGMIPIVQTWIDKDRQHVVGDAAMPIARVEPGAAGPNRFSVFFRFTPLRWQSAVSCQECLRPFSPFAEKEEGADAIDSHGQKRSDQQILVADGLVLT